MLADIEQIARIAGEEIMNVYRSDDFSVEQKEDDSPLTRADTAANEVITLELQKISSLPIVSEENTVRASEGDFWLVDPLDGTKGFIARDDNFTVNIALIQDGRPVLGVVYAPALEIMYAGDVAAGMAMKESGEKREKLQMEQVNSPVRVVTSSRHKDPATDELLVKLGEYEEVSIGSSLKLCYVADGQAEFYPRLGPTHLWDTAAAHAVVAAAGGYVTDTVGNDLEYKLDCDSTLNPHFYVFGGGFREIYKQVFRGV